ncbi:adenine phosphoribosyltransferase [Flagellimonas meridianipacifica]|uniref:Adenine phosphoribosyltransferase n=1 Tax=Flagellimonas meridianipacifica TaxID=1080225 RepID=A0A2T0M958_9FLAO|nr:adenine phosphoribosyltransferase [Allomuricauda pacifica]PRX54010.1 adenine phosphoribosyltransferase [Allomuricauda pacifica]
MNLKSFVRDINDFPKPGIVFKDITPLFNNAKALKTASEELVKLVNNHHVDKVVGMESRGFIFAPMLASQLNAGFVPVRKKGKLPYDTIGERYGLEYGTDELEIHVDAISPGERVLVHDDVLATGGTAAAVQKLIEKLGGEVVQCNFLITLEFLNGRDKLEGLEVASLMQY